MALFGYANFSAEKPLFKNAILSVEPKELHIGDRCKLGYSLDIGWSTLAHIRLEYGIDFIKSNDKPSRKLFLFFYKIVPGNTHLHRTRIHSFAE